MVKEKTGYPSIDRSHEDGVSFLKKHPIIPNVSVYELFKIMNSLVKGNPNINCLDLNVTYAELLKHINTLAKSLKEIGIKKGDIVTVCAPNYIQSIAIFFAANKIGAVTTFINSKSGVPEIQNYLNNFESPLFVNYNKNEEELNQILSGTHTKNSVTIYPENLQKLEISQSKNKLYGYNNLLSYNDFQIISSYYNKPILPTGKGNDDALILFTSGSTGSPKMPVLTNGNVVASAMYMKNSAKTTINNHESSLITVAFNYPYGFVTSTLMSLLSKKDIILAPDLTLSNIDKYFAKKPNVIFGIPPIYRAMMTNPEIDAMSLEFLKIAISGGDTLSLEENQKMTEFLHQRGSFAHISNGSGSAELSGATTDAVGQDYKPDSVGKVLVGTNAKVMDPVTKEEVKNNENGVLAYSGKHVFSRYYNDPEATEAVKIKDSKGVEWYVGDTYGSIDEEGYNHISGRERRYFITFDKDGGAYKGYCDYIQQCISALPEVAQCAIVNKETDVRGSVPYAYIVLNSGYEPTKELMEIIWAKCQRPIEKGEELISLKQYEVPDQIEFLDALPLTEALKVDYKLLERKTNNLGEFSKNSEPKVLKKVN